MGMTPKEKILAVARGEHLDRLPVGARIDLWYNYNSGHDTLPEKYKGWDQTAVIRDQGATAQLRYFSVVREEYHEMEVIEKEEPPYVKTEYRTPLGSVYKTMLFTTLEGPWIGYEAEKMYKSEKDYPIIEYVLQHITPVLDSGFDEARRKMGEDGMVMTGVGLWSPTQRVMREIMGFEPFFYELADHPAKVESLIKNMENLARSKYEIGIKADLEIFNICSNWSDDVHTPVFKKYFIPWFQEITELLHSHGRLAMAHIDGENRRLLPFLKETGIDIWEAWTPKPMTSVTNKELRNAIGDDGVIWGGVPSTLFEPTCSDEEFDQYVINMFKEIAPGYNFIVGMGDNLPFDGDIERVGRIVELIDKFGRLPISA
jgi:uroporphyrinogen-III decarboxylase